MEKVFTLIVIFTMILLPVLLLVWLIKAIRKKPTKKIKVTCLVSFAVFIICTAAAISLTCSHEWSDATCSAPKTCKLCGETEGESLQHQWEAATCASAKKCAFCGLTEGVALDHTWEEATCSKPKTCKICGETEGETLPHTPGDWNIGTTDYVSASFRKELRCTECQSLLDYETVSLDTLHEDGIFILTPDEFGKRLDNAAKTVASSLRSSKEWMAKTGAVNSSLVTAVGADYKDVGVVIYSDKSGVMDTTQQHTRGVDLIGLKILTDDTESMSTAMIAAVMACDPSLTVKEAAKVISEVTERYESKTGYTLNGITYMVVPVGNAPCLMAS